MYRIKRKLSNFSAAHRLINGYQGKCQHLHGHNYDVEVIVEAKALQEHGFVVDFTEIKKLLNTWVQEHWDHVTLVIASDRPLIEFLERENMKHFVFENAQNTTAECLAHFLYEQFTALLQVLPEVRLCEVIVAETESCQASYGPAVC